MASKVGTKDAGSEWLEELRGADIVFGRTPPPEYKSEKWAITFWLPSDLSELEDVTDPLLLIDAGTGYLHDVESKMDAPRRDGTRPGSLLHRDRSSARCHQADRLASLFRRRLRPSRVAQHQGVSAIR